MSDEPPTEFADARDPAEIARELEVVRAMDAALFPLREVSRCARAMWGETSEARFADALRLSLAELLTSLVPPGSPEFDAADRTIMELRPSQPEEDQPA